MRIALIVIYILLAACAFAQPGKVPVKKIDGKSYHVHTVEQGQTLWKIKKMYNVPLNDIMDANDGLTNDIKEGQEILIPTKVDRVPVTISSTNKPVYHVVEKGETVFGLTRKYEITEKQFLDWNKDAKNGLKVGDKVIVGYDKVNETAETTQPELKDSSDNVGLIAVHQNIGDSIVEHKVQAGETLYTLSKRYMVTQGQIKELNDGLPNGLRTGDIIKIKIKKEKSDVLVKDPGLTAKDQNNIAVVFKDKYTVALFAPLTLWKNAQLEAKRSAQDERKIYGLTKLSVDFYNGVQLALDSLEKAGISVNLKVFDTGKDSATVYKVIEANKLENVDLILGPFFKTNVVLIADYAKENKIPMIIPVQQSNKVLFNNPYVSKSVASNTTKMKRMADYIAKSYPSANIILVSGKSEGDKYLAKVFKDQINSNSGLDSITLVEAQIGNYSTTEIKGKITKYRKNIIVVTSRSEGYVTNVVNKLIVVKNSWDKYQAELVLFGLEEWENFSAIDPDFKQKLDYHYVATQFIDYDSSSIKNIYKAFRSKIGYDPDEMGINGFDIAFAYVSALNHFGSALAYNMENIQYNGLINHFALKQVEQNSGFENNKAFILRYIDYKAELVE
jgi:LysM repeat protein/ABC-type branched-subunit amino acid transport system substrate-binding protein